MKNEEMEKLLQQSVHLFLKKHIETLSKETDLENKSFVYLDGDMLQIMMVYLFLSLNHNFDNTQNHTFDIDQLDKLDAMVDDLIVKNNQAFEAIFALLNTK